MSEQLLLHTHTKAEVNIQHTEKHGGKEMKSSLYNIEQKRTIKPGITAIKTDINNKTNTTA